MQILTGLGAEPWKMAFSPDGRYLAVGDSRRFHLWDLSGPSDPLWATSSNYISPDFCFAPDGTAVLGGRSTHHRYDVRTGAKSDHQLPEGLHPDDFSPDNRFAVAVYPDAGRGVLRLLCARDAGGRWEATWRKELAFKKAHNLWGYRSVRFSADGGRLVRVYNRGPSRRNVSSTGIEVFDSDTGQRLAEWTGPTPTCARRAASGPSGTVVLLSERALYAIDTTDPDSKPVKRLNASPKHFTWAAFTRDGSRLATTSNDTAATVWGPTAWEVQRRYEWQIGRLRMVCFAPDGLRCAAASDTGRIVVWDLDE
jgi:WD40 repeat protein